MESVEAARALKSSLRWELATKLTKPVFFDEFPGRISSGEGNVVAGEDFPVEDFLNFSNEEFELGSVEEVVEAEEEYDEDEEEEEKDSPSVSSSQEAADDDSASLLDAGLAVPGDCLSELEWVSQFVEDSPLDFSLVFPVYQTTKNHTPAENRSEPERRQINAAGRSYFPSPIPVRPRTKRSRTSRVWSLGSPLSESSSTPGFFSTPCLLFPNTVQNLDLFNSISELPSKKQKKKPSFQTGGTAQFQRRCSHCQVQKTPQWRTGPLGSKTLCNACGVRYKSGRLFPEYRPACSPTFSVEVHSNSHRKVLEMRKRKEISGPS